MKKILFIMVFLSSFINAEAREKNAETDCLLYAAQAVGAEWMHYGPMTPQEYEGSHDYYFDLCNANDGNLSSPIFI